MTIEDMKAIAIMLEKAGVDSINVSIGVYASWYTQVQPAVMGHGWISDMAREIKTVVKVPVSTVGRINDPIIADSIIASGKADFVHMGRASLADPFLPRKAKEGRFCDIIRCIACLQGCTTRIDNDLPGQCMVNPRTGREYELNITETPKKKNIWVIGGGPAGAEAAIVAAQRGHNVILYEKNKKLGGMFHTASVPPWKGEITTFLAWQITALNNLGVKICLNTEVTESMIKEGKPDTVIVATGSNPIVPPIPGKENVFVKSGVDLLNAKFNVTGNIAVIGGGLIGGEVAHYLITHGNKVTIIEVLDQIVKEVPNNIKHFLFKTFDEHKVKIYTNTTVKKINPDGTIIIENSDGIQTIGKFDSVLMATGVQSEVKIYNALKDCGIELVVVGDAKRAANALEAIQDAYITAMTI
jgi:NADPH-dependent 2,4-dienoyl-CoA reductase/sulfur reductase-like enzyme